MELYIRLGLALGIGLLIGVERGWRERAAPEGSRIAGVRTLGLVGLLGGLWALLAAELGELLLGLAFAVIAVLMIIAHTMRARTDGDVGITTVVAALVTFALGALAVRGYESVAAAGGVITAALLSLKPVLHGWLRRVEARDFYAVLQLLLISVVLLPVLPDQGYGPWNALNPYEIWWMVVLIAGISFAGYVAMKAVGTQRGIMLGGLFGGLVSSTAVTLNYSRLGRENRYRTVLAAGVLVAAGTMFPRILIEVAVINPVLLELLALPLVLMAVTVFSGALWLWHWQRRSGELGEMPLHNPLRLATAVKFGLLLAAVMLLAEAFRAWLGEAGVYLLAGISGISDVDAITLSMARMAQGDLPAEVAVRAIMLAAMVNTIVKGVLATFIGGMALGARIVPVFVAAAVVGTVSLFLL